MTQEKATAETAEHAEKAFCSASFAGSAVKRESVLACLLSLALATDASAATKAIKAGRVVDASGRVITNAVIVVDNDRITSIGTAPHSPRQTPRRQPRRRRWPRPRRSAPARRSTPPAA